MAENINEIINRAVTGSAITLPVGEFEGPVVINKPLHIKGNNTTLWGARGAVLEVRSSGVSLENLRVELTENPDFELAVKSDFPCSVRDVEVLGGISGFGAADGGFAIPRTVDIGEFAANDGNTFTASVTVGERTEILCPSRDITFTPSVLEAGENQLTITVSNITAQTLLYAEVMFKSTFTRRVYITGKPIAGMSAVTRELDFPKPVRTAVQITNPLPPTNQPTVSQGTVQDTLTLQRGQRVLMSQYINGKFSVYFTGNVPYGWELDPYVFLLNENGKVTDDNSLVFFGNERSPNGEVVYYPRDGHVEIDVSTADYRTNKIVLAYSIYAGDQSKNFSQIKNPVVKLHDTQDKVIFPMGGLSTETTVVAMEIYRYKGEWKISAIGAGYSEGMAKLCNSYGLEVV